MHYTDYRGERPHKQRAVNIRLCRDWIADGPTAQDVEYMKTMAG